MTAARTRLPCVQSRDAATTQGAILIDAEVDARLVALRVRMSTTWRRATRSDALRAVILAGLPIVEAAYPPK